MAGWCNLPRAPAGFATEFRVASASKVTLTSGESTRPGCARVLPCRCETQGGHLFSRGTRRAPRRGLQGAAEPEQHQGHASSRYQERVLPNDQGRHFAYRTGSVSCSTEVRRGRAAFFNTALPRAHQETRRNDQRLQPIGISQPSLMW